MLKVVAVDDEPRSIEMLKIMLEEIEGVRLEKSFTDSHKALTYLLNHDTDIVFLDVEMPGIDGIMMAGKLKQMKYPPKVVYITGFTKYSLDAWKMDAMDYVLKPYRLEDIRHAISRCVTFGQGPTPQVIRAVCFPRFDLFVDGRPLTFRNKKAKELLALLVHYRGDWVDLATIIYCLFGDRDESQAKNHYNVITYRLRGSLAENGISGLVEVEYGKCRVCTDEFSCDYYEYLDGNHSLFQGDYMQQYSWAEPTVADMTRRQIQ